MGYVNNTKDPELVFKIDNENEKKEIDNIRRMVDNMNNQLTDSGYGRKKHSHDSY
jgi:predicted Co/Zn/Cd cation transporter (cation efflux family)